MLVHEILLAVCVASVPLRHRLSSDGIRMSFPYKTQPYGHQSREFEITRKLKAWARFWEMGTGKTKTSIDETASLFFDKEINGLFVVAPNGVHRNWIVEELPRHLPDSIKRVMHWYSGQRHASRSHQSALRSVIDAPTTTLAALAMSYDSLMTEHGRLAAREFMMTRRCMYIADEARRMKDPTAKRTKRMLNSAPFAPFRRILNGTPVSNGPFDVYSQIKFLDEKFWERHGISSFMGFKTTFANFKPIIGPGGRSIQVVDSYKNLDMLHTWLQEISSRVCKEDVLDLPPKVYSRMTFELTPEQQRIYDGIVEEFMVFLETGDIVSAPLAITRLLRLQQVTCGYVPADDTGKMVDIGKTNPRLELLETICEDLPHKAIIWSRFKRGIDDVCNLLGKRAVRYDGSTSEEDRAKAIESFQRGDAQFFVGNQQAAGEGITLHAARTVIRYARSFDLAVELQSDDRAHRIGQAFPVNYIDLVASGTVDVRISDCLEGKMDVAGQITGDRAKDWLRNAD